MPATATIAEAAEQIAADFALFDEYRDKIEYILDRGRHLPPFPESERVDANLVPGCQSRVWLVARRDPATGRIRFAADSEAFIVKGLIALLLQLYDDRTPEEILANPPKVLDEVGLTLFLTPGRSNGLASMIARIQAAARALAQQQPRAPAPA
ncbi:MAG: SufE family protein [Geminicoccaceae bacterium]|nr:SufE family protein [Geminicoccaceae bacterium]